jgi:hypothetical protein
VRLAGCEKSKHRASFYRTFCNRPAR